MYMYRTVLGKEYRGEITTSKTECTSCNHNKYNQFFCRENNLNMKLSMKSVFMDN